MLMKRLVGFRGVVPILLLAAFLAPTQKSYAAVAVSELTASPETTVLLGAQSVVDHGLASDDLLGGVTEVMLAGVPTDTNIDAFARLSGGDLLLSFGTRVALPGPVIANPGDIVRYDGAEYSVEFDADLHGLPPGVDVDALAVIPLASGGPELLLSFDTTVQVGGLVVEDDDLVRFDGSAFDPALFFDASAAGLIQSADLDAAQRLTDGRLLLSFDVTVSVGGGIVAADEDVLEYDPTADSWAIVYDGSARHPGWMVSDLDAVHATCTLPEEFPELDVRKAASGVELTWSSVVGAAAYDVIEGSLDQLRGTGGDFELSTAGCTANDIPGTSLVDAAAESAIWYLVRAVTACGNAASLSSGGPNEIPGRDNGTMSSGVSCP